MWAPGHGSPAAPPGSTAAARLATVAASSKSAAHSSKRARSEIVSLPPRDASNLAFVRAGWPPTPPLAPWLLLLLLPPLPLPDWPISRSKRVLCALTAAAIRFSTERACDHWPRADWVHGPRGGVPRREQGLLRREEWSAATVGLLRVGMAPVLRCHTASRRISGRPSPRAPRPLPGRVT